PVFTYDSYEPDPEALRNSLGVEPNRQIYLLFGGLSGRKGICELLEATTLLTSDLSQKLCILLVGPMGEDDNPQNKLKMDHYIAEITRSQDVQIIVEDRFVPDREIQSYFKMADVILAPHQRHVGMSANLVRAAVAQKPLLSSDYGLMGEIARQYQLGLTVDSTIPKEIAKGLTQFLVKSPAQFGDRSQMQRFAEQNTAKKFATTIFQNL
ncbi:MAG: glycosyltransferase, partial [Waterburya sp.]